MPAPAATSASAPAPPTRSPASASSSTRSIRNSASSATPAARSASSTPSRSRPAYSRWPKGGQHEPHDQDRRQADDRRPDGQRQDGRDRALGGPPRRHRDPRPVPRRGHGRLGRLPPLPGRGRGPEQAAGGLHHLGRRRSGRTDRHRRACAPSARATSRCTSRTTTPTARRPARTPARRTSTSRPTWPRSPTATWPGAAAIVRDELPFPGILGRVCPRYCEPVCRRGDVDDPIAICALHRAAGDHAPAALQAGAADRPPGGRDRRRPGRPQLRLVPGAGAVTR